MGSLTDSLNELLLARTETLGADARHFIRVAAIVGRRVTYSGPANWFRTFGSQGCGCGFEVGDGQAGWMTPAALMWSSTLLTTCVSWQPNSPT